MREDILSFVGNVPANCPFYMEMTGISYCDGSYSITRKNSSIYVFEYILSGRGTVKSNSSEFTAVEGDMYILHRQNDHFYYSDSKDPWVKIWFNIRGPLIDSLLHMYRLNSVNHIQGLDVREFFFKILDLARSKDKNTEDIFHEVSLVFHELILKVSKRVHKNVPGYSPEGLKLKEYLDKNVMLNVSVKELGNIIFRSPSQTIRIFKKDFGTTPYRYLLEKKLEIAKLMLLNTSMSIKEISISLHFADEHYFSNYFKSKTGFSPSDFKASAPSPVL